jgi:hypothetical protein
MLDGGEGGMIGVRVRVMGGQLHFMHMRYLTLLTHVILLCFNLLFFSGGGSIGTYYYSDHGGIPVVTSAHVTVTIDDMDKGTDTTSCTQEYSRNMDDDGTADCDAGHILAHRLGGPGNQPINIFPQDLSINRGAYNQYEDQIYHCITGGASADLTWKFYYDDTTRTKPNKVRHRIFAMCIVYVTCRCCSVTVVCQSANHHPYLT